MSNIRKIPMRRETIKALEVRRNTVMGEARRKSTMQTLGANNEFNRNKNRHRNSTTVTGNIEKIYAPSNNSSKANEGYEMNSDEDRSTRTSVRIQTPSALQQVAQLAGTNGSAVPPSLSSWKETESRNSQM